MAERFTWSALPFSGFGDSVVVVPVEHLVYGGQGPVERSCPPLVYFAAAQRRRFDTAEGLAYAIEAVLSERCRGSFTSRWRERLAADDWRTRDLVPRFE